MPPTALFRITVSAPNPLISRIEKVTSFME